ncbi:MAG: patatin-like phospholipase family protein, partial [Pseudomonadota bacterium]
MHAFLNNAFRLNGPIAILLLSAMLLNGCVAFMPDRIHYVWNVDETGVPGPTPQASANENFVGLAFSGGGSRAAYFAAAGAEALHERGILQQVTHISSVSGGSMAASYLATRPPGSCSTGTSCTDNYFAEYKEAMRRNYFRPMAINQVTKPNRFLSPTRRASSLQNALDAAYLEEITFGNLPSSPVLLINAASYDDGSRFVFSNRPIANEDYAETPLSISTLRSRNFAQADCVTATPDDFPVSLAVATSAAFPPALGPVAIEIPPSCGVTQTRYWHLGDGGILENTGVETLQEVLMLDSAAGQAPKRAVIFSFDAGKRES